MNSSMARSSRHHAVASSERTATSSGTLRSSAMRPGASTRPNAFVNIKSELHIIPLMYTIHITGTTGFWPLRLDGGGRSYSYPLAGTSDHHPPAVRRNHGEEIICAERGGRTKEQPWRPTAAQL